MHVSLDWLRRHVTQETALTESPTRHYALLIISGAFSTTPALEEWARAHDILYWLPWPLQKEGTTTPSSSFSVPLAPLRSGISSRPLALWHVWRGLSPETPIHFLAMDTAHPRLEARHLMECVLHAWLFPSSSSFSFFPILLFGRDGRRMLFPPTPTMILACWLWCCGLDPPCLPALLPTTLREGFLDRLRDMALRRLPSTPDEMASLGHDLLMGTVDVLVPPASRPLADDMAYGLLTLRATGRHLPSLAMARDAMVRALTEWMTLMVTEDEKEGVSPPTATDLFPPASPDEDTLRRSRDDWLAKLTPKRRVTTKV